MSDEGGATIPGVMDEAQWARRRTPWRRRLKIALRNAAAGALSPLAQMENLLTTQITILSYHRVLPDFPPGSPRTANVDPALFAAQMDHLVQSGYRTLALSELQRLVAGEDPPARKAVVITFDDGYADNCRTAHMIAREHGVTVNYFLPTGIIGLAEWPYTFGPRTEQELWHMRRFPELWRPLTWDQVRRMAREGAHFGCHGYLHRRLSALAPRELEEEIRLSAAGYAEHLGERSRFFSIPWGDAAAFTLEALPILERNGFEMVFTTRPRRLRLPHWGLLYPRISVREHDTPAAFARKLEGAHDWLHRIANPLGGRRA